MPIKIFINQPLSSDNQPIRCKKLGIKNGGTTTIAVVIKKGMVNFRLFLPLVTEIFFCNNMPAKV